MSQQTESTLNEIKSKLLTMAGYVEQALSLATESLQARDAEKIAQVLTIEDLVDQLHKDVDEACLQILALQQPLAADLRLILAVIKINIDLERMADQAVNVAENAGRYLEGAPFKTLIDLPQMVEEVRKMVRGSLDAFVRGDVILAQGVRRRDPFVDNLKNKIFRDIIDLVKLKPQEVEQGLNLILIARNLERIGDHATNIAEDVIFMVSGEDVRHSQVGPERE